MELSQSEEIWVSIALIGIFAFWIWLCWRLWRLTASPP